MKFFSKKAKMKNYACTKCGCNNITDWAAIDCYCDCHDNDTAAEGMSFLLSPKK